MTTLHLVITNLCDRTCKHCCNKLYDTPNMAYATDEDFEKSDILCLTGGEPFVYANPCNLAKRYRADYPHLSTILVYTNAKELYEYLCDGGRLHDIDGLNISCKTTKDAEIFNTWQLPMNTLKILTEHGRRTLSPQKTAFLREVINWRAPNLGSGPPALAPVRTIIPYFPQKNQ